MTTMSEQDRTGGGDPTTETPERPERPESKPPTVAKPLTLADLAALGVVRTVEWRVDFEYSGADELLESLHGSTDIEPDRMKGLSRRISERVKDFFGILFRRGCDAIYERNADPELQVCWSATFPQLKGGASTGMSYSLRLSISFTRASEDIIENEIRIECNKEKTASDYRELANSITNVRVRLFDPSSPEDDLLLKQIERFRPGVKEHSYTPVVKSKGLEKDAEAAAAES